MIILIVIFPAEYLIFSDEVYPAHSLKSNNNLFLYLPLKSLVYKEKNKQTTYDQQKCSRDFSLFIIKLQTFLQQKQIMKKD